MTYAYIVAKRRGKVHEVDGTGMTYCKAEKSTPRLTFVSEAPPKRGRCWTCKQVKEQRQHDATRGVLDSEFRSIVKQ